ncbi:hypothetical protein [Flavobacterium davisii]|uniref:Uncharacterized protein n=1 Tax=Flavobacterium columnare TaxID=996 RepID=A0A8G0KRB0_9FLAO|nr:hypothetical protein [Flavobacterium davisii]QYS88658.1 hypothetical protein JJC05_13895 [Flavobacterium davisii]
MKNFEKMQIVNPNAAGIDVGSRSHFVAIGQNENQIREFNVYQLLKISYIKLRIKLERSKSAKQIHSLYFHHSSTYSPT